MPNISITTCFDYSIPIEKQIEMFASREIAYLSLGMNTEHSGIFDEKRLESLLDNLEKSKMSIDTVHSPVNLDDDSWYDILERTFGAAKRLSCPVIVLHLTEFWFSADRLQEKLRKRLHLSVYIIPAGVRSRKH